MRGIEGRYRKSQESEIEVVLIRGETIPRICEKKDSGGLEVVQYGRRRRGRPKQRQESHRDNII